MTMKKLIFLPLLFWSVFVFAQRSIAVQSNGTASFYTDWATAWQNTQAGDTIYLPGATFNTGNIDIDKPITIIGVGHDTAYVHNRLFSYLNGTIRLLKGADGTTLHGFRFGSLLIGTNATNDSVENITISRCRWSGTVKLGYSKPSPAKQITITECAGGTIDGMNATEVWITKNMIPNNVSNFNNQVFFYNNIFPRHTVQFQWISYAIFRNNIFGVNEYPFYYLSVCERNEFKNNIFRVNLTIDPQTDLNFWEGNFFNQPLDNNLVNFVSTDYLSTNDYHLKEGSVGIGAGTDGFDIGIYGTAIPYKEGAVPFTPRIVEETVSKQTDAEGKISVKVKVEAQER